jgi:urease accessory protein
MRGGRELWLLPVSFLLMMAAGAGLHFAGFTLSAAETWVAFSVMASGLLVWTNYKMSSGLVVALVAVFALSHGYVHDRELQTGADAAGYTGGFLLTTVLLQRLEYCCRVIRNIQVKNDNYRIWSTVCRSRHNLTGWSLSGWLQNLWI